MSHFWNKKNNTTSKTIEVPDRSCTLQDTPLQHPFRKIFPRSSTSCPSSPRRRRRSASSSFLFFFICVINYASGSSRGGQKLHAARYTSAALLSPHIFKQQFFLIPVSPFFSSFFARMPQLMVFSVPYFLIFGRQEGDAVGSTVDPRVETLYLNTHMSSTILLATLTGSLRYPPFFSCFSLY